MYKQFRSCNANGCTAYEEKKPILENICNDVMSLPSYNDNNCNCGFDEDNSLFPNNSILGESYVQNQVLNTTFMPNVGLKLGTIFPELVRPYMPGQSMEVIQYLQKTNNFKEECNSV